MSAYNKNGKSLAALFSKDGNALDSAYNIGGDLIWQNKYRTFTDTVLYSVPSGNNQGFDVCNGKIIQYIDKAYTIKIIDIATGMTEKTLSADTTTHGNDITITPYAYSPDDEFNIVLLDSNAGFRIKANDSIATRVITIHTPHGDGKSWVNYGGAFNGNTYYTVGYSTTYTDTSSLVFVETWDCSNSIENPTLISQVTRPWLVCIQGASFHDGLLWCACGIGNASTGAHIYSINPDNGEIIHDFQLNHSQELEGIAWVVENNEEYIIYSTYQGSYHKVTFS